MINNSFRKTLIQYLHPFGWLSMSYGNYNSGPLFQGISSNSQSPRSRIMRPSKLRSGYSFRDFAQHCQKLQEEQPTDIIKRLQQLPVVQDKVVHNFIKENQVQGQLFNIVENFDFLSESLQSKLQNIKIQSPSPIQKAIIPIIYDGNDVIAIAETGSGKTLAFALPGIVHLQAQPKTNGPRILVLAPTRELAQQIQTQYGLFTKTCCLYGGVQKDRQYESILGQKYQTNDTPKVIIATPGRLLDFINDGLPLNTITQVVLDEADRMLDMGFEDQIKDVLKKVRNDRQTLFFSATWPYSVQKLAQSLCQQDPIFLQLGERGLSVNKNIEQKIIVIDNNNKFEQFAQYIENIKDKKMLIFCSKKSDTQKLEYRLSQHNVKARYLHGDLNQGARDYVLKEFKTNKISCLITTNLASRGLDVNDIEIVINYDFPENIEDYIHRIGRTGRAGKSGLAVSFIESRYLNYKLKRELIDVLKQSQQQIPQELYRL